VQTPRSSCHYRHLSQLSLPAPFFSLREPKQPLINTGILVGPSARRWGPHLVVRRQGRVHQRVVLCSIRRRPVRLLLLESCPHEWVAASVGLRVHLGLLAPKRRGVGVLVAPPVGVQLRRRRRSRVLELRIVTLSTQRGGEMRIVTCFRDFGWEIAHAAVTRRSPISLDTIVPRIEGYTYDAKAWDLPLVQGPFSAVPNPTLRFAVRRRCNPSACIQRRNRLRIVTVGISGGRSLTRPLRDARRFPSTRWYPVPRATRTPCK
jgi:hypothetical protein